MKPAKATASVKNFSRLPVALVDLGGPTSRGGGNLMNDVKIDGPVLRYFGGKWRIAPWLTSIFPKHSHYTEVFGGGASVLLRKPRVASEVYNDLDTNAFNLFRVLRDPKSSLELSRRIELTPFSREEFFSCKPEESDDRIERARKWLVVSHMRFGVGNSNTPDGEGFRASSKKTYPAITFVKLPRIIQQVHDRLRGVLIENLPAIEVLKKHDIPESLHYVDPPYVHLTRTSSREYSHEMTDRDHVELCQTLLALKGSVVVSNYANPIYDSAFSRWSRIVRKTTCEKGLYREEIVWIKASL